MCKTEPTTIEGIELRISLRDRAPDNHHQRRPIEGQVWTFVSNASIPSIVKEEFTSADKPGCDDWNINGRKR